MLKWLHRQGSYPIFFSWSQTWIKVLMPLAWGLLAIGLVWGLAFAPTDYQQKDAFRMIYVHVPSAWLSMFVYVSMAFAGGVAMIWRLKIAEVYLREASILGMWFTILALITGMIWGKPMWGAWWVWDARLTSELILLFLYWGVLALGNAYPDDPRQAGRAMAILALVGVVNIPIIHYSVEWWNSLHQANSRMLMGKPSLNAQMLWPLLLAWLGFMAFFGAVTLMRMRNAVMYEDMDSQWLKKYFSQNN